MEGALFHGDETCTQGDVVVGGDVGAGGGIVDRDAGIVDPLARVDEGAGIGIQDAELVVGGGHGVGRIGGEGHLGGGMGIAVIGDGKGACQHRDGTLVHRQSAVAIGNFVVAGHVLAAVHDAEGDLVGDTARVVDGGGLRGDFRGMSGQQLSRGEGEGGVSPVGLGIVHPLGRLGLDRDGAGGDLQPALAVGNLVVFGHVISRLLVIDTGLFPVDGVGGGAHLGDGGARQRHRKLMGLHQRARANRPAVLGQGGAVVDLGGAVRGDGDGAGVDGQGAVFHGVDKILGHVPSVGIMDAEGAVDIEIGGLAEDRLAPGIQGQGMPLGETHTAYGEAARHQRGAVVVLGLVLHFHRDLPRDDGDLTVLVALDDVVGGDVLAAAVEFHRKAVLGTAHVAAGCGVHGAVLVSHAVLDGGHGMALVGAVIGQSGAVGDDRDLAGSDGEGARLDKEGVVMGLDGSAAVADGEGQDVVGSAAIQNGGGGLHLQVMSRHQGGGGIYGKVAAVQLIARVLVGNTPRLDDQGTFFHRQLARLHGQIVEARNVGTASVVDTQLGGVGLGARIHQGIAEDGDEAVPLQERALGDLVAVIGEGGIVEDLGGVLHRDGQRAGLEAHRNLFHVTDGIARHAVVSVLVGDAEGVEIGVGGGVGGAVVGEEDIAGSRIPLGEVFHLDAGRFAVLHRGIRNGEGDLAGDNGEIVGIGVGLAPEGGLAPGANPVFPGEHGLGLAPGIASLWAVFVVGLRHHEARAEFQLVAVGDLGGAVGFQQKKTPGHDQNHRNGGQDHQGYGNDEAVGVHLAEDARDPLHLFAVGIVLHRISLWKVRVKSEE